MAKRQRNASVSNDVLTKTVAIKFTHDPVPNKLTMDSQEFSIRQLAKARMAATMTNMSPGIEDSSLLSRRISAFSPQKPSGNVLMVDDAARFASSDTKSFPKSSSVKMKHNRGKTMAGN